MAEKEKTVRKSAAKKTAEKKTAKKAAVKTAAKKKTVKAQNKQELDPVFLTGFDRYLINAGRDYKVYKKMGAHHAVHEGRNGMHFAVWAPHAKAVAIVCDRNGWNPEANYMIPLEESGVYEGFIPDMGYGELYKYAIHTKSGDILYKADPYGFSAEFRPGTASKTADIDGYNWDDAKWMTERAKKRTFAEPMAIYECHLGSWFKNDNTDYKDGFLNYTQYAKELVDYCGYMGYTHVELMGIAEYPFDGSWGYQVTGYYAPTSRYGEPKEFMYLVDYLHQHNIGVILDWVPAHFPKDAHGLADFDGEPLFEYADPRMGEHPDWGTKCFDYSKPEVLNFMIGNALYWYDEYHIDGLRVDAVASMLYLDYGRKDGQWVPNKYGGNGNLDAMEFFKHLNSVIRGRKDGTIIIAEESTAWPKVTAAPEDDGLGFTYKWNMGWMHDSLQYMSLDPIYRQYHHSEMTFSMIYAYDENFILSLSHDECTHGKHSMLYKMPGDEWQQAANLRAFMGYMYAHPGKKLNFMGTEFAQTGEWNHDSQLQWWLLQFDKHKGQQQLIADLNKFYRSEKAMYDADYDKIGFFWLDHSDYQHSIFSWIRRDKNGKNPVYVVSNMTPTPYQNYRMGVLEPGKYQIVLNTDDKKYWGSGYNTGAPEHQSEDVPWQYVTYSVVFNLPPLATVYLKKIG